MNICAFLAYSQLKTARSRTAWALTAVSLSTALTTAVGSLAAGGIAMLKAFLGPDYGEYGGAYKALLLIPAVAMAALIGAMSVIVISNVFRVSARERRAQFGALKCVGATGRQIGASVIYEGLFLSAAGIPLGLLLGLGLACIATRAVNLSLGGLDALVHLMIREIHLSLPFVLSWETLLVCALISLLTVLLSAWLPARRAALESAMDSLRNAGDIDAVCAPGPAGKRFGALMRGVFGFEGELAVRNLRRSRRSFRATVAALSSGVILFISLASLSGMAKDFEDFMQPDIPETVLAEYSSARIYETNEHTGLTESVYLRPIGSELGNAVTDELEKRSGAEVFGMGLDLETYRTALPASCLSPELLGVLTRDGKPADEFAVELITLDAENYRLMCEKAGVPAGSTILLNNYRYNDRGRETDIVPFTPALTSVELIRADGSRSTLSVDGVLTPGQIPCELIYLNMNPVRLLVPDAQVRSWAWYAAPGDEAGFIACAEAVMAESFPEGEAGEYMDAGFNTRVYRVTDYVKVMNIAVVILSVLLYGFVALLMLIGLTNVISTVSANIAMRRREFAVLQSVGQTGEGLRKMLMLENALCSGRALLTGLPIGTAISLLISLPVSSLYPIPWRFPWLAIALCSAAVFALTLAVTAASAQSLHRRSIIETIRSQGAL